MTPMKRILCLLMATIILGGSPQVAYALTYYDECNSIETTEDVATYVELEQGKDLPKTVSAIDNTYLNPLNRNGVSMSVYKMRGVERVRVKVFSSSSLYAVNSNGNYVLGYKSYTTPLPLSAKYKVMISANDNMLYSEIMGTWYRYNMKESKFIPLNSSEAKPLRLINFGIHVFYSDTIKNMTLTATDSFRKLDSETVIEIGSMTKTPYFYETYEFDIPSTAKAVAVAIYDANMPFPNPIKVNKIRLARVEFEGAKIELGAEEEVVPPPPPKPSSSSNTPGDQVGGGVIEGPSSSKKSSSSKSSSSKSSSSKSSSSKSSSSKSSSSKSSSSKSSSSKSIHSEVKTESNSVKGNDEIGKSESVMYITIGNDEAPKTENDAKAVAVTIIYSIIVLTGIVTFVLKVK